ncbi:transcriptional regulator GcvA [Oceanimonas baumannii]|uniref:LysR family glycine cleavage system transcriptional activator n=1 Tax=Oceanimonas baumannii TaxID=129578 RepID=A0A235CFY0_9GAMM|nr:transcriptional regulator GcvA [Oceanimonas baumannii]OYD23284.1 hypothetical protein B6S09_12535 [Oceanimonas baumannii]TDW58572.1 LysR family glycine cleavage system transcriptional activator [Oceanimonas baumannii]
MKYRLPPMTCLQVFEACARHGSFRRAADELCITPPAVTHQIKQLEAWLDAPLFRRLKRGICLTEQGKRLSRELEPQLTALARTLNDYRTAQPCQLTLSLTPALSTKWLVTRLGRFWHKHADIELKLHHSLAVVDLLGGEADMAIRWGEGEWPGLAAEPLLSGDLKPVCSPALLAGRRLTDPTELEEFVLLHEDSRDDWQRWLALHGLNLTNAEKGPIIDDAGSLLLATAAGQGVALGRVEVLADELAAGRLVCPFDTALPSQKGYWLVYPHALKEGEAAMRLREFLLEEAAGRANG